MIGTHGSRTVVSAGVVVLTVFCAAKAGERQDQPTAFTSPEQLLVDKETDLAAIVKIRHVENRWVILPDGDHVPLLVAQCEMEEVLSGKTSWAAGGVQSVVQLDYSGMIFDPIAPPAIEGRRYLLWAFVTPKDSEVPLLAPWTAHPQGFLLIRRQSATEFVFWSGKSYGVSPIRVVLKAGRRLLLDRIDDPVRRLRVAEGRLERKDLGDERAFIQGLLLNVLDPEGQAKKLERRPKSNISTDVFGMSAGDAQPHAIWYKSLTLLRDLGKDEKRRKAVVTALTPVAQTARPRIRLAAALALADLGSNAGREALIQGFESDSGSISSDPPDQMTFPGRYHHDESSITACAYALARLGDRRGLAHATLSVRLAAADALKDKPGFVPGDFWPGSVTMTACVASSRLTSSTQKHTRTKKRRSFRGGNPQRGRTGLRPLRRSTAPTQTPPTCFGGSARSSKRTSMGFRVLQGTSGVPRTAAGWEVNETRPAEAQRDGDHQALE